jgi:hypothetical protein
MGTRSLVFGVLIAVVGPALMAAAEPAFAADPIGPCTVRKGSLELAWRAHGERLQSHVHRRRGRLDRLQGRLRADIIRIQKVGDLHQARFHVFEQLDPFCLKLRAKPAQSRDISAGRATLAITPVAMGSPILATTMGTVVVARLAASVPGVPWVTITSTLERTRLAASSAIRSYLPSAQRYTCLRCS